MSYDISVAISKIPEFMDKGLKAVFDILPTIRPYPVGHIGDGNVHFSFKAPVKTGEYVVRMDAHSEYPPNYIAGAVERLLKGDVDWVCGPAIAEGNGRWSATVAAALRTPLGQGGSRKWEPGQSEVELDTGVFTGVWRHSYLTELGGWDEGWPINQDSELAARVFERGGRIVCLPELFRSRYFAQREDASLFDLAEPVPGPSTEALSPVARQHKTDGDGRPALLADYHDQRSAAPDVQPD